MAENKKETPASKQGLLQSIFEWIETFCLALLGVVVIFTFVCRFVTVKGPSMMNTLHDGDRLIISSLFYTPKAGDIVVVHDTQQQHFEGPVIKRVIATAGETIDIDNETWQITVTHLDGTTEVIDEPYANVVYFDADGDGEDDSLVPMTHAVSEFMYPDFIHENEYPHVVKDGCVFVLGDNRTESLDSRYVGDIDERKILGKAYIRLFPLNDIKFLL